VIETGDCGINRYAEVDRSAATKSMLRAHSRLEELVGVELEQLQVPQQQGGHGDLLDPRDFCELTKVSDISVAFCALLYFLFSLYSWLLGKNFPRLYPLNAVKITILRHKRADAARRIC